MEGTRWYHVLFFVIMVMVIIATVFLICEADESAYIDKYPILVHAEGIRARTTNIEYLENGCIRFMDSWGDEITVCGDFSIVNGKDE